VTDRQQRTPFSLNGHASEDQLGVYDDFDAAESRPAYFVPGLVNLSFIGAAIRRSMKLLLLMAVGGLVLGAAVFEVTPHPYQASASVLITLSPYEDSQTAALNNQALAETRSVAQLAESKLGLQQNVGSFLSTYTATSPTDLLLTITASAPSASQATVRANAIAAAFLEFRANELQAQQSLVLQSLQSQLSAARQRVSSINTQISQLSSLPASATQQSKLASLRTELVTANSDLGSIQQGLSSNQASVQPALNAAVKGSQVLSVAGLGRSKYKSVIGYAAIGFIAGLALGLVIIIIRALVSSRLRQRDEIAAALDAPVKLSVSALRAGRWGSVWPGRAATRDRDMKRVVAYLQNVLARSARGSASLAIVAVDDEPVAARAVTALAASYASGGGRVLVADLSAGGAMAHLLRASGPGLRSVSHEGANFTLAVPDRDDPAPIGPLRTAASVAGGAQAADELVRSYESADCLLTLVTLDPAAGGDHLGTWAANAVVVAAAGQSSAERLTGVSELIRLAGTRLDSVVLIGADKSDQSLGLARDPDERADLGILG
jgi:capsular polysaccharide biosynthesis protein